MVRLNTLLIAITMAGSAAVAQTELDAALD